MTVKSSFWGFLNLFARVFGLVFTAAGAYFSIRGAYFLIRPEAAGFRDTLGFSPAFRPLVIAAVLLIIGVHFIRGEAHRPDLPADDKPGRPPTGRTHSWWTGEPLNKSRS